MRVFKGSGSRTLDGDFLLPVSSRVLVWCTSSPDAGFWSIEGFCCRKRKTMWPRGGPKGPMGANRPLCADLPHACMEWPGAFCSRRTVLRRSDVGCTSMWSSSSTSAFKAFSRRSPMSCVSRTLCVALARQWTTSERPEEVFEQTSPGAQGRAALAQRTTPDGDISMRTPAPNAHLQDNFEPLPSRRSRGSETEAGLPQLPSRHLPRILSL